MKIEEAKNKLCPMGMNNSEVMLCCTDECIGWEPEIIKEFDPKQNPSKVMADCKTSDEYPLKLQRQSKSGEWECLSYKWVNDPFNGECGMKPSAANFEVQT